jgi:hypothetical protein
MESIGREPYMGTVMLRKLIVLIHHTGFSRSGRVEQLRPCLDVREMLRLSGAANPQQILDILDPMRW